MRLGGIEVLRAGRVVSGFEEIPERISSFYACLAEKAVKGAMERLAPLAEGDFENAKAEGQRVLSFFRRYNYLFDCRAKTCAKDYVKVSIKVTLTRSSSELYSVENVHFWNISEQKVISENRMKKALLRREKIVKK